MNNKAAIMMNRLFIDFALLKIHHISIIVIIILYYDYTIKPFKLETGFSLHVCYPYPINFIIPCTKTSYRPGPRPQGQTRSVSIKPLFVYGGMRMRDCRGRTVGR